MQFIYVILLLLLPLLPYLCHHVSWQEETSQEPLLSLRVTIQAHPCFLLHPPDDVEDGWYEELIVDGHSDVTWLMEGRGYGPDCVAQVYAPQQEQELSWNTDGEGWSVPPKLKLHTSLTSSMYWLSMKSFLWGSQVFLTEVPNGLKSSLCSYCI